VFFDVDGMLVPDTSTSQHLAHRLRHLAELSAAEAAYAAGKLSNQEVSVRDASAWRGRTLARRLDRHIETVALVWQYGPAESASLADECSLQAVYGKPVSEESTAGPGLPVRRTPQHAVLHAIPDQRRSPRQRFESADQQVTATIFGTHRREDAND
jgi:hypothetical protein